MVSMGIGLGIPDAGVLGAAAPSDDWLLTGGIWNDSGVWLDSATWED